MLEKNHKYTHKIVGIRVYIPRGLLISWIWAMRTNKKWFLVLDHENLCEWWCHLLSRRWLERGVNSALGLSLIYSFLKLFYWGIITIYHYISFRCTIQWFGICIHCEMITIVSLANTQHQRVTNFIFLWWEFLNSTLSELLKYAIQYY